MTHAHCHCVPAQATPWGPSQQRESTNGKNTGPGRDRLERCPSRLSGSEPEFLYPAPKDSVHPARTGLLSQPPWKIRTDTGPENGPGRGPGLRQRGGRQGRNASSEARAGCTPGTRSSGRGDREAGRGGRGAQTGGPGGGAARGLGAGGWGPKAGTPGPAAGLAEGAPRVPGSGSPQTPRAVSNPAQRNGTLRQLQRGETVYQGSAGAGITVYTDIHKYLHHTACRQGFSGRPRCSSQPGRGRRGLAENNKYHFLPARSQNQRWLRASEGSQRRSGVPGPPLGLAGGGPAARAPGARAPYLGQ